jgi:hypothetical protein
MENYKTMKIKIGSELVFRNQESKYFTVGEIYVITELDDYKLTVIDNDDDDHDFSLSTFSKFFKLNKTKKDTIVKAVTDKFKQRSKVGIEKYGTTLAENNTDDFLEHLQQELMDATLYIQKLKEQNRTKDISTDGIFFKASQLKNLSSEDLLEELHSRNLLLNVTISKSKL